MGGIYIDGDIIITITELIILIENSTGTITRNASGSGGAIAEQEQAVTDIGIFAGVYDPEWSALISMEI